MSDKEIPRPARYPLHSRAQLALSEHAVLSGRTLDVSLDGICILIDDQIPVNGDYLLRFELPVKGKPHVIMARVRSIYGVFASHGGFRVRFRFKEADPQRSALIKLLAGKKPMVDTAESAPPSPVEDAPTEFPSA